MQGGGSAATVLPVIMTVGRNTLMLTELEPSVPRKRGLQSIPSSCDWR